MIVALPMYDWPERHGHTDAQWQAMADALRAAGLDAPARLTRSDEPLDRLWRRSDLFLAQTCWGPMEAGLRNDVLVVGQPDYSDVEGGEGAFYSSAFVMRKGTERTDIVRDPACRRGLRFAFNARDSRSGHLAPAEDLGGLSDFAGLVETGGHRLSLRAVAEGRADLCAVDCRSWALGLVHEPATAGLAVVGWTRKRLGLPYITAQATGERTALRMRAALLDAGAIVA